jgi:O-acetylserine/cysteine efflux transporter
VERQHVERRQERLGLLFAAACALNGAFVPALAKLNTTRAEPLLVATATSLFAGAGSLALLAWRGELGRLVAPGVAGKLLALGALGTAVTYLLLFAGTARTSAIETALCLQVEPVYSLVLSWAFLGHPVTLRRLGAVGGILLGIALTLQPVGFSGWVGVGLLLATPIGWQVSHLIVLRGLRGVAPRTLTGARYVFGGVILLGVWSAAGGPARLPPAGDWPQLLGLFAIQGVLLAFVGTLLWYETIARLDLLRATAIVVPSVPVLSLGASFLLLGEVAVARQWAGLVITAAGILAFVTAPDAREPRVRVPSANAPIVVSGE